MTTAADISAPKGLRFDYKYMPISDLQVKTETNKQTGLKYATGILVDDEEVVPTRRFWTSLMARFGISDSIFKYFDHSEVFLRISDREETKDRMRMCIERRTDPMNGTIVSTLLGVSSPNRPVASYDDLVGTMKQFSGENIRYHDGIVESFHAPRVGGNFDVGGDAFQNRFIVCAPIDGYGSPAIYLAILRLVCQNGVVAQSKAFRSELALGRGEDDTLHTLVRSLDSFNNDEGYAAIRKRLESATTSWLSVFEAQKLYQLIVRLHHRRLMILDRPVPQGSTIAKALYGTSHNQLSTQLATADELIGKSPVISAFHKMTGDMSELYGLANLDALSMKRQRSLPVKATVYDAINFMTEVGTHYTTPEGARMMNGLVGETIINEYDLEGTVNLYPEFSSFHIQRKLSTPQLTGSKD